MLYNERRRITEELPLIGATVDDEFNEQRSSRWSVNEGDSCAIILLLLLKQ
jgi:hypothetical protein